jgi:YVTN family beta-propeller protein
MSFELAPGTLLNNRYQIKKVITFSEDGGVYLARDLKVTDKNWIVKELIPASELDEETLNARRTLFTEAVESAMQFDQPSLPRILDQFSEARREYVVMEFVDGVTLQTLCDMSVNPLPEKQILNWSLQICDALIYLHNRPKPFIFGALSPAHIILTPDEKIKLINFGLDRFFRPEGPPKVFADDPGDVVKEFANFGETMCFLLTKEKPGIYGIPQGGNVSAETAKVVNRTLQGEQQKAYDNFEDVRKELEIALNPPTQPKKEAAPAPSKGRKRVAVPGDPMAPPAWVEALNRIVGAFASQSRGLLYGELGAVVILIGVAWWFLHPAVYRKTGPVAYFSTANTHQITALSIGDEKVVDRQGVNASIGDMIVAGNWLFVTDANTNKVLRFDTTTDQAPEKYAAIPVDRNPTRMVADEKGRYLFVVHEPTHNVSRINLTRDPPAMDAIMAVGNVPQDLAVSPRGDILFVANAKDMTVSFMDPDTNKNLANVSVAGTPFGMAAAPEASGLGQLWVCVQDPDSMAVVDIPSHQVKKTITDLMGGKSPTAALFSADGSKVYVAMAGSNSVVVFDTSKLEAIAKIDTGPAPKRLLYTPSLGQIWAIGSDGVTIINPATDTRSGDIKIPGANGTASVAK